MLEREVYAGRLEDLKCPECGNTKHFSAYEKVDFKG